MLEYYSVIKFYQASRQYSLTDLLDLLLKRYSNIEYVMNLDSFFGFELIAKAVENDSKERLYLKWLNDTAKYEMSFDDYYKASLPYRKSSDDEKQEILQKYGG